MAVDPSQQAHPEHTVHSHAGDSATGAGADGALSHAAHADHQSGQPGVAAPVGHSGHGAVAHSGSSVPADPAGHGAAHHADGGPCNPTPEQAAAAKKLLDDTRAAIARFPDPADATLAGYQWVGNDNAHFMRVWHYSNFGYYTDDHVADPSHVEGLLYGQTDRHGMVLVGAYYIFKGAEPPDTAGCATPWHSHRAPDWMLHVWTVDMPGGPFAETWDPNYIANM